MTKPEFFPPKPNPIIIGIAHSIMPVVARYLYKIKLEISPTDLEKLTALKTKRLLLLPNHPTLDDWIPMFLLSSKIGKAFYYMAAYEGFKGLIGKLLQSVSVYSIKRGMGDRYSIAQTLEILMQPSTILVIFPEGGCSYQNDTVMPFRSGAIQLPLQAINKLEKQGESVPELYIIPMSLKYQYIEDMTEAIDETLKRLEKALNIAQVSSDFYQRLRSVAQRVMINLEKEYELYSEDIAYLDWNQRISRLKNHVLESCEQKLGIIPPLNTPARERIYKIQYILGTKEDSSTHESIYKATVRLLNFDAIYDGYVAAEPTPERFLDTLIRLEREVFSIDQPSPKGDRKAVIRIGEPVNLQEYFEAYKQNKAKTVEMLTEKIQQTVQKNLNSIEN